MKFGTFLLVTTTAILPALAHAQTAAPAPAPAQAADRAPQPAGSATTQTGDIVVTATRRSSSLQSTPVTLTALGAEQLAKMGIARVDQIAAGVPNFYMQPGIANSSTISLGMRGKGDNGGGFGTTEQPVSFYFDDVYQARPSAVNGELADIERVEVLRGPQGTLFGRNSMVGAVNIITKTPDNTPYAMVSANYGSFETVGAKAAIGMPIVKDQLALSISGVVKNQGTGYMHDLATGKTIDKRDYDGVRAKLHYYGSDIWDIVLAADYSHNRNDGFVASPISVDTNNAKYGAPLFGERDTITTVPQFGKTDTYGANAHIVGKFGGATFKSITGWSEVQDYWNVDLTGGAIDKFGKFSLGYNRNSAIHQHQFTQELQLYGDGLDKKLSWIIGAFFFTETTAQTFKDQFLYPDTDLSFPDIIVSVTPLSYRNVTDSYAGYAQLGYHFTPSLELTAGGRYTHETKSITGVFAAPTETDNGLYAGNSGYNAFTPKVGLNWQIAPQVFSYASWGKGFSAGGYTAAANSREVGDTPFGPQRVDAYEVGLKSEWFDRKVKLNLAAFLNNFKDVLVGRFLPNSAISVMFNGESYRVVGLELESNFRPVPGLDIYANGGIQHASNFVYVPGAQVSQPLTIPEYSGLTGFRYETRLGTSSTSLRFGLDYVFRQGTWGTIDREPGTLYSNINEVNAEISLLNVKGWKLSLTAHNLFNHYEYQNNLNFAFINAYERQPMLPRIVTFEASYKF